MRAAPPEIVLLDIRLPGMDGYEICRQMKADPRTKDIPVIFVSALDDGLDKARAFEVGGIDYVAKPFSSAEVVARVENQLKISRLQRHLALKNTELERANRLLQSLSYVDALTGIPNRRHFDELLDQEWRRALRDESSMAVVLIDVDLFKAFNDNYGHQSGDDCLKHVAVEVSGSLRRGGDLAARYGGEEFGVEDRPPRIALQGGDHQHRAQGPPARSPGHPRDDPGRRRPLPVSGQGGGPEPCADGRGLSPAAARFRGPAPAWRSGSRSRARSRPPAW
jgi:CheY-like chemotaxis protein